jgi:hypothetical protein
MTAAQRVKRVCDIGRALLGSLADLGHAECPRCGRETLDIDIQNVKAITITCTAPPLEGSRRKEKCGYERVIDRVRIADMPEAVVDPSIPVFTERVRATQSRRSPRRRQVS